MFLLSKIFARIWFKTLIGSFIILFLLITVGDIINGFLRGWEASRVFIEYFLKVPFLMSKMIPVGALLASLFTINNLKNHSELMAILAGGYSIKRIYSLILIFSLFVAFVQFINVGFVLPKANKIKRMEFEKSRNNESKYLARSNLGSGPILWYKSPFYFASFSSYDPRRHFLHDVSFYFEEQSQGKRIIKAKKAQFLENKNWKLSDGFEMNNLREDGFPKVIPFKEKVVQLEEAAVDFEQFESDITTLDYFQLRKFISSLEKTDINVSEYEIMLYEKMGLALICIIFALFPVAEVFKPNRRSSSFGKSVVFTLVFSIGFWMIYSSLISLGLSSKIPVLLATLGFPVLLGGYIFFQYRKHRRL